MSESEIYKGVVRGKTIELEQAPGLPEGQEVRVTLQPTSKQQGAPRAGEGIRLSEGSWADDPRGLDEFLDWNQRQRKRTRPEIDS